MMPLFLTIPRVLDSLSDQDVSNGGTQLEENGQSLSYGGSPEKIKTKLWVLSSDFSARECGNFFSLILRNRCMPNLTC